MEAGLFIRAYLHARLLGESVEAARMAAERIYHEGHRDLSLDDLHSRVAAMAVDAELESQEATLPSARETGFAPVKIEAATSYVGPDAARRP
jgi:hypothetical protein